MSEDAQPGGAVGRKWPHRYDTDSGHGSIDSGGLTADLPNEGDYDAAVLGPSRGLISVSTNFGDESLDSYVTARLSPEQARLMAKSLQLAADQAEEESQ